jgi:hypothetical protein
VGPGRLLCSSSGLASMKLLIYRLQMAGNNVVSLVIELAPKGFGIALRRNLLRGFEGFNSGTVYESKVFHGKLRTQIAPQESVRCSLSWVDMKPPGQLLKYVDLIVAYFNDYEQHMDGVSIQ